MTVKWINILILWMEKCACTEEAKEGMSICPDRPPTTLLVAKEQKKKVEILP
jgi:hypothetical protein